MFQLLSYCGEVPLMKEQRSTGSTGSGAEILASKVFE